MSEPVRIGILGCARIAKAAIIDAAVGAKDVTVVAVASRDLDRARSYAAQHGIGAAYGDYADLLADPGVDAIYNALPNSLHAHWSIQALESGKAVLCEKPLASNAAEAGSMVAAARRTGKPLMEAFHYRHHPLGRFISEIARSQRLGRLVSIDAGFEVPAALVAKDDIRFQAELAGGAMMDVGAYGINVLRLVAGEEPRATSADATIVAPGVDGAMKANFVFPSGAIGSVSASLVADRFRAWLTVEGERGRLEVSNPFVPHLGHGVSLEEAGSISRRQFDLTPSYVYQARAFAAFVRDRSPTASTAADGVANMAAIDAIYLAAGLRPRRI
ncbi:MAG TPA: Gfo/Idh/MocA family oxidoreductase [Caulobacteraceae bacterium]|nr:Gfo/Idh/MocA family oxidoreductase [Caulobacteraceae bacterium]